MDYIFYEFSFLRLKSHSMTYRLINYSKARILLYEN